MAKTKKDKEYNIQLQFSNIEILEHHLNANKQIDLFSFDINIESKANTQNKQLFVLVNVIIKDKASNDVLGSIKVNCIFNVTNFEEAIKVNPNNKFDLPSNVIDILNSISLSTTRGVMFSIFRGTVLHHAILPIIDPKKIQKADKK